jgi:hypothetical protein
MSDYVSIHASHKGRGRPCLAGRRTSAERLSGKMERIDLYTTLAILLKEILQHIVASPENNLIKPFNIQEKRV